MKVRKERDKVECCQCGLAVAVSKDGKLARHGKKNRPCPGSHWGHKITRERDLHPDRYLRWQSTWFEVLN